MKEEWRKQMQRKMADYEESDINLLWSEIDKALEANRQKAMASAKGKTLPLWFRRFAAAAVILLLAGVGFWTLQHQTPKDVSLAMDSENASMTMTPGNESMTIVPEDASSTPPHPIQGNIPPHFQSLKTSITTIAQTVAASVLTETTGEEPQSTGQVTNEPTGEDANKSSNQSSDEATISKPQPRPTVIYPYELRPKASSPSRLTARVYFSNTTAGYSNQISTTQQIPISSDPINPGPTIPPSPSDISNWANESDGETASDGNSNGESHSSDDESGNNQQESNTRQGETQQYRTQQTSETTRHHQPVRFGFSLRYRLNDRWSIESGLTYTRLSADFTKTVDDKSVTTEQRLNYIGIPVTASYLLWGSRYVNIYLSAGAMVEKMISGSRTAAGVTNSVSIHPLQFSVNGAAGAEFRFTPQFSLYAEPGLGYWFDNGSDIPTYYQEKPLSFSLSLGLRLSLWDNN